MKYALIEDGIVKQIVSEQFPFAETESIFFREFDDNSIIVKEGYIFDGTNFSNPISTSDLKDSLIKIIKSEAYGRIITVYPEWKQRNLNGAVTRIQNNEVRKLKGDLDYLTYSPTADDVAKIAEADTCEAFCQAIRTKSDELETSLDSMTAEQLEAFDPTDDSNWT